MHGPHAQCPCILPPVFANGCTVLMSIMARLPDCGVRSVSLCPLLAAKNGITLPSRRLCDALNTEDALAHCLCSTIFLSAQSMLTTKLSCARLVLGLRLLLMAPHVSPVVPVGMYFCVILVGWCRLCKAAAGHMSERSCHVKPDANSVCHCYVAMKGACLQPSHACKWCLLACPRVWAVCIGTIGLGAWLQYCHCDSTSGLRSVLD